MRADFFYSERLEGGLRAPDFSEDRLREKFLGRLFPRHFEVFFSGFLQSLFQTLALLLNLLTEALCLLEQIVFLQSILEFEINLLLRLVPAIDQGR